MEQTRQTGQSGADREYLERYHAERNHQGLSNELTEPDNNAGAVSGKIEWRERLGGPFQYYHRIAAQTECGRT